MSCFNPDLQCRVDEMFPNGYINGSHRYGQSITYSCNEGFRLVGDSSRRCRSDRKWTGSAPTCIEVTCLVQSPPENGFVSSFGAARVGEEVSYRCDDGYQLSGVSALTCQSNGSWSNTVPSCIQEIDCAVNRPRNGDYRTNSRFTKPREYIALGGSITYVCFRKYEMVNQPSGRLTVTCLENRRWSSPLPTCRLILCDVPRRLQFGSISTTERQLEVNERFTYRCNAGYRMEGRARDSLEDTCQRDGSLIAGLPACTKIHCPLPEPPRFGSINRRFVGLRAGLGDRIEYSCGDEYRLEGATEATCQRDDGWSNDVPDCVAPGCEVPEIPSYLLNNTRSSRLNVGEHVWYWCMDGYVRRGGIGRYVRVDCLDNGEWSAEVPQCKKIGCTIPDLRCNVDVDTEEEIVEPGTSVTYSCEEGYRVSGSQAREVTSTCREDETWARDPPKCVGSGGFICVNGKHEIYFLFDLSDSVSYLELNNSLTFAVKLIQRLAVNARNLIEYGVMVFASEPKVLISTLDDDVRSPDQVIDAIVNISLDRATIQEEVRRGRHTQKALRRLSQETEVSYFLDHQLEFSRNSRNASAGNDTSKERHVFIFIHGEHNEGRPPEREICALSARDNPPTFYSVTTCLECAILAEGSGSYRELLALASGRLENFIIIDNFYLIPQLLDQITDARIDYSECGQAGDVGSLRQQARVGRVISGTRASTRSWPWQVGISLFSDIVAQSYTIGAFQGGGSLINNRWVLTAAHLFEFVDRNPGWEEKFLLSFGMHILPRSRKDALSVKVKVHTADKIIEHPDFARASLYDFDVALMRIGKEYEQRRTRFIPTGVEGWLNYTEYIRPVCLPCMENSCVGEYLRGEGLLQGDEMEERKCEIETDFLLSRGAEERVLAVSTGFGHVEERMLREARDPVPSQSLQQGLHRVREDYHCGNFTEVYLDWGFPGGISYTDQMLCATSGIRGQNIDSCQLDSGGPLVREVSYATEEERKSCWVQVGIVSFGWGCGQFQRVNGRDLQVPSYYTNVMSVSSWTKAQLTNLANNSR